MSISGNASTRSHAMDPHSLEALKPGSELSEKIAHFIRDSIDLDSRPPAVEASSLWTRINQVNTSLWLDSGNFDSLSAVWSDSYQGVTTNNTLINAEVQRGTYDDLIAQASGLVESLEDRDRIRELAFILNARHALRLVERFRCQVSIELHTDLAHDVEATVTYARRCHEICPEFFIVKVPLTPAGLIAIRELRRDGIRINCTLGFSARQNYFATALSAPSFVNVFLGRLNSYVSDNDLGDGALVGEKATIASQQEVSTFTRGLPRVDTQQIAASVRNAEQLPRLAGVDVITMPTEVAEEATESLSEVWVSRLNDEYRIELNDDVAEESVRLEKLWEVSKQERNFAQKIILHPPESEEELVEAARALQLNDLFPSLSDDELQAIADDGKIPDHKKWEGRIARGDLAIDSLMNLAGLASFAASQKELDERIARQLELTGQR